MAMVTSLLLVVGLTLLSALYTTSDDESCFERALKSTKIPTLEQYNDFRNGHNWIWDDLLQQNKTYREWFSVQTIPVSSFERWNAHIDRRPPPRIFFAKADNLLSPSFTRNFWDSSVRKLAVFLLEKNLIDKNHRAWELVNQSDANSSEPTGAVWNSLMSKGSRLATLKNVHVNKYGVIIDNTSCLVVRNGGCTFMTLPDTYAFPAPAMSVTDNVVVSLGASAHGFYHFTLECLMGLAALDSETLSSATFLVSDRSAFKLELLELLGVARDRVTAHPHILAQTLLVPEMSACFKPGYSQLNWLAFKVLSSISGPGGRPPPPQQLEHWEPPAKTRSIILIERTRKRTLINHKFVHRLVEEFAARYNYSLAVHSDSSKSPLVQQLTHFSTAAIVVSSHGAGQSLMNFLPEGACVIDMSHAKEDPWFMYARIAFLKKLSYILQAKGDRRVSLPELLQNLYRCSDILPESEASFVTLNATSARGPGSGRFPVSKLRVSRLQRGNSSSHKLGPLSKALPINSALRQLD